MKTLHLSTAADHLLILQMLVVYQQNKAEALSKRLHLDDARYPHIIQLL